MREQAATKKSTYMVSRLGMHMSGRVWWNVRIDLVASIIFSLFNVVVNQFYIAFAIQHGATHLQVGILSAAPAIGLLFSPIWASLIEKAKSPRLYVIIPNIVGRALMILPAFVAEPIVFVIVSLVYQILMGIQSPAYAALVSRMYPSNIRGRLMGYVRVAMGGLMIPLAFIVGSWAEVSGTSMPLIFAAVTGTLSISLFYLLRVPKQSDVKQHNLVRKTAKISFSEQWQLVKTNRMLTIFLIATTFAGFGNMLAVPLYQIVQVDVLQLSNLYLGYARVAYYVALLIAFIIVGWMIDKLPIKYTLVIGILAYALVPLIYSIWGNYSAVITGYMIQAIGDAIWDIGILAFVFRLLPGREAMVFGIHLLATGIRGSIGPLLGASLTDSLPIPIILLIASACSVIGTLLFIWGNRGKNMLM
ncbi:MFS transporter [Paenibacillus yanchengensis]|uniref:MFS transporter n=1 Tax=Paenibacillus yanchengensis TaxID=2035833 RepID=A0ABW4YQL0_9BACL